MKIASIQKYDKHTATNYEMHMHSVRSATHRLIVSECKNQLKLCA